MDESPLIRLPGEVRNMIYTYALREEEGAVRFNVVGEQIILSGRSALLGLPSTCRQIRNESRALYFASNSFEPSIWNIGGRNTPGALFNTWAADMARHNTRVDVQHPTVSLWLTSIGTIDARNSGDHSTLRTIMTSLGCSLPLTCKMSVESVYRHEKTLTRRTKTVRIDITNVEVAMHSIREVLRPELDQMGVDETNETVAACVTRLEQALSRP